MKKIICDVCGNEITGSIAKQKWYHINYKDFVILICAGQKREPHTFRVDICRNCLLDAIKNEK